MRKKFKTYFMTRNNVTVLADLGEVEYELPFRLRQPVTIEGNVYYVSAFPAEMPEVPKVLVKGKGGEVLNDEEPERVVRVVQEL